MLKYLVGKVARRADVHERDCGLRCAAIVLYMSPLPLPQRHTPRTTPSTQTQPSQPHTAHVVAHVTHSRHVTYVTHV